MKETNEFLHKYEAHASLSDRKHYAKRIPMSMSDFHRYNTAMDVYEAESYVQREPYVEMYIPQHKFDELVQKEAYYNRVAEQEDQSLKIIKQMLQDDAVRRTNPAVDNAWRKYQMLLELARTQHGTN